MDDLQLFTDADLLDSHDRLGRALAGRPFAAPAVVALVDPPTHPHWAPDFQPLVEGSWVAWRWLRSDSGEAGRRIEAVIGLLDAFIALDGANDAAVAAFVQHWGPLGLCDHLFPWMHHEDCEPLGTTAAPRPPKGFDGWEPCHAIRLYARHFRGLLTAGAALQTGGGGIGRAEDWRRVYAWPGDEERPLPRTIAVARRRIGGYVSDLLEMTRARLGFRWRADARHPALTYEGVLVTRLVLQLAAALTARQPAVHCTECGDLYVPTRKPARGRDNYCRRCGPAAAKRNWRRKQGPKRKQTGARTRRTRT